MNEAGSARIVLFDLGNVVVDWQPVRLYKDYFPSEAEARHFLQTVCTMDWHRAHDQGVDMQDNARALIQDYPQYKTEILAWRSRWMDMFEGYVPGVPVLMARLEQSGVPLYGLSNIPAEVADETFDRFAMIHVLRDVIVSGAEGVVKPDRRIYEIALERMGQPAPETVLFIDDSAINIEAAHAMGFRTHHFQHADGLEQALKAEALL